MSLLDISSFRNDFSIIPPFREFFEILCGRIIYKKIPSSMVIFVVLICLG